MTITTISAGKQTGHRLCFLHSNVLRHEVVDGVSVALVTYRAEPDYVVHRGTTITAADLSGLRTRFVICANGALQTYQDAAGGMYFAIPVASVRI